jgi:prepilin-type N-terminal cleavage/methylation domain-containing protein
MRRQRGFSLIELLIVIAIILALAAMAIPNLLRSKMSANEASAVSSLRAIATAQTTYQLTYPTLGYADELTKLAYPPVGQPFDSNHAGMIDWVIGCAVQPCPKAGYQFSIGNTAGTPVSAFMAVATPQVQGQTGRRGFCLDQAVRITQDLNGTANCTQPLE